jgi:hypothetical protein
MNAGPILLNVKPENVESVSRSFSFFSCAIVKQVKMNNIKPRVTIVLILFMEVFLMLIPKDRSPEEVISKILSNWKKDVEPSQVN